MSPLMLVGVAALLLRCSGSSSSSSHSLRYFYTSVSDPGQAVPQFYSVGYVDEQPFVSYDAATRRVLPEVPWMEEVGKEDPQYWDGQSQILQGSEAVFRVDLGTLMERYNQNRSTGVHVLQAMYGCEVGLEGRPQAGHLQYGYDGEDFLSFDKETLTWTAADSKAEITKQKLDPRLDTSHRLKSYLEEECTRWLWRYLDYGKEELQRTVPPTVKVARKKYLNGLETLFCRAHGFYPKEIEVSWMKDGVQQQDTLTGGVIPNSDGTYHQWLSIEVDPQDRDLYRCHVEHDGLPKPLDLAWEEPAFLVSMVILEGVIAGSLLAALIGVLYFIKKRNPAMCGYKAAASTGKWQPEMPTRTPSNSSRESYDSHNMLLPEKVPIPM